MMINCVLLFLFRYADNHDQHSNSSSHSNNQQQQQQMSTSATSASNNMSVTNNKKTEQDGTEQDNGGEVDSASHVAKRLKNDNTDKQDSELMIEPKNEYDDDDDEDEDNVEDLTMDELEDLDQAGPSHVGEGSSQGTLLLIISFNELFLIDKKLLFLFRISLANGRTKSGRIGICWTTKRRTR
jgi:hypothetical protein